MLPSSSMSAIPMLVLLTALASGTAGAEAVHGAGKSSAGSARSAIDSTAPAHLADDAAIDDNARLLAGYELMIPIMGVPRARIRDTFEEVRGTGRHEAIDIVAPRGTPVHAAGDGRVVKLFNSVPGGLTVYQFDPAEKFAYYYAHLDAYAAGLSEGMVLARGDVLGYVGTTGNAPPNVPHLHFAIFRLGPDRRWWQGTAVNPYLFLNAANR